VTGGGFIFTNVDYALSVTSNLAIDQYPVLFALSYANAVNADGTDAFNRYRDIPFLMTPIQPTCFWAIIYFPIDLNLQTFGDRDHGAHDTIRV